MAHLAVVQAVEARLKAGFSACPIFVENEVTGTPAAGAPWILVDFPWSRSDWVTADEFEEEGAFRVLLALKRAAGAHVGRAWLDEIAALFRGQAFDGVQCFAPQGAVTNDSNETGTTFRLSIAIPYTFIITQEA